MIRLLTEEATVSASSRPGSTLSGSFTSYNYSSHVSCHSITKSHILQRRKDEFCSTIFWLDTTLFLNTANAGTARFVLQLSQTALPFAELVQTKRAQNNLRCALVGLRRVHSLHSGAVSHHSAFLFVAACLSGRFSVVGRALVIHIKWAFNGANGIHWQFWGEWERLTAICVSDWGGWSSGITPSDVS